MANALEVREGVQYQTADERLAYKITTTNWVSSPTGPVVAAYDETGGNAEVTSTVFPANTPAVAGDDITLSLLRELTAGHVYRIEVKFTTGTNIWEFFFKVKCEI